jgi:hypothetical protein
MYNIIKEGVWSRLAMVTIKIGEVEGTSVIMLAGGLAVLAASVFYGSSILAFIGLGLAFWGALLLYIRPEEYMRKTLLNAAILPFLDTLNEMIQELNYRGEALYLPPRYFVNPESTKVYVAKQKGATLPTPELIQEYETQLFVKNPEGLLLTPPGAELASIFEKKLGISFTRVDFEYLQRNMPKLFIEDLEIAENLEMEMFTKTLAAEGRAFSFLKAERYSVQVKINNPMCREVCEKSNRLTQICEKIGCPICSAIGCALTKATGAPVMIENVQTSEDRKTVEITYGVLGVES